MQKSKGFLIPVNYHVFGPQCAAHNYEFHLAYLTTCFIDFLLFKNKKREI